MKEIHVGKNESGQRLDKLLAKYLNLAPKSFIYKMLRKKNITLNGKKASGNEQLKSGDTVILYLADDTVARFSRAPSAPAKAGGRLDIVYEDEELLLLNKPAGMLSQKAKETDVSLVERLTAYLLEEGAVTGESLRSFRPSVCNRLDRNTSGLVAAGKTLSGLQELGELFRKRTVSKYYRCLVAGRMECGKTAVIEGYLKKDERRNQVRITGTEEPESAYIRTEYLPLAANDRVTLLEVHLITGKTHQIRAHLSGTGHPIIGDPKYGDPSVNEAFKRKYGLRRQLLHSYRLEFPVLEGTLAAVSEQKFTARLPEDFRRVLAGELPAYRERS